MPTAAKKPAAKTTKAVAKPAAKAVAKPAAKAVAKPAAKAKASESSGDKGRSKRSRRVFDPQWRVKRKRPGTGPFSFLV